MRKRKKEKAIVKDHEKGGIHMHYIVQRPVENKHAEGKHKEMNRTHMPHERTKERPMWQYTKNPMESSKKDHRHRGEALSHYDVGFGGKGKGGKHHDPHLRKDLTTSKRNKLCRKILA